MIAAMISGLDDAQQLLKEAKREATGEIVRRASAELPYAINRLVVARYRGIVIGVVLGGLLLLAGGVAAGWWLTGALGMQCAAERGGLVCWYWQKPPTDKL